MTHFSHQPASRPIGDEPGEQRIRQLTEPWSCSWKWKNVHRMLTIPVGYVWDGMSIPRWAISFVGIFTGGMGDAASLPHDALYRAKGGHKPEAWKGCILSTVGALPTRKETDWLLGTFMRSAGFNRRKAAIARAAVVIGGRRHWGGPSPYGSEDQQ